MSGHEPQQTPAILAVDDTPNNLDILTDLLDDYHLFVALDGPTALALTHRRRFDLILLDIMMPGMDGFELCCRLKADAATRDIPVIFISAMTDIPNLERAFALGGVDYVTKPFRPAELRARVQTHLQLHAMRTRLEAVVEDEVAKRQLQERIMQRQSRLAVMGEMLDAVAHQWNQPLGAIALANDLLSMQEAPVPAKSIEEHCDMVRGQIAHMQETLHDFRQFLRPGNTAVRVDTLGLIENVRTLLRTMLTQTRITLATEEIAAGTSLHVNPSEFTHVLLNLVINAADAYRTNPGNTSRSIRFLQRDDPSGTRLIVEDDAGGIPEAILPAVFNADVSGKPAGEGSGIGLYMSRSIIEKHGGTITVENTATGARFTITLP